MIDSTYKFAALLSLFTDKEIQEMLQDMVRIADDSAQTQQSVQQ